MNYVWPLNENTRDSGTHSPECGGSTYGLSGGFSYRKRYQNVVPGTWTVWYVSRPIPKCFTCSPPYWTQVRICAVVLDQPITIRTELPFQQGRHTNHPFRSGIFFPTPPGTSPSLLRPQVDVPGISECVWGTRRSERPHLAQLLSLCRSQAQTCHHAVMYSVLV